MEQHHNIQEIKTMHQFKKIMSNSILDKKLIVIDFFADWCPPCKLIAPYIDELAISHTNIHFFKINTGTSELKEICMACEIKNIPTFCYFRNNQYIDKVIGIDKNEIMENIEKYQS